MSLNSDRRSTSGSFRQYWKDKFNKRRSSGKFSPSVEDQVQHDSPFLIAASHEGPARSNSQVSSSTTVIHTQPSQGDEDTSSAQASTPTKDDHVASEVEVTDKDSIVSEKASEGVKDEESLLILEPEKPPSEVPDEPKASPTPQEDVANAQPATEDPNGPCLSTLRDHGASVQCVSWTLNNKLASASYDGTVRIWDATTGRCLSTFKDDNGIPVSAVGWLRNPRLALVSGDGTVRIWRATDGRCLQSFEEDIASYRDAVDSFSTVAWSPEGNLAFANEDGSILIRHVTNATGFKSSLALNGRHEGAYALAWSRDGRLASGAKDGSIKIWDTTDGQCKLKPGGHNRRVYALDWSRDGRRLASASEDNTIKVWETQNGHCTVWAQGQSDSIRSLAWSPDGRLAGADGDIIRIWDGASGRCLSELEGHTHQVQSVTWSDDGKRLASASRDRTVKIWNVMRND